MNYINSYKTNDIELYMTSDGTYLTGLWFKDSKDDKKQNKDGIYKDLEIFKETKKWLDIYFNGSIPDFTPVYKLYNVTDFQKEVINILNEIPYGTLTTYSDIANKIAKKRNINKMSNRAVGHAVGSNPICIIIPCHRVIGKNNDLTGYGGGIENKIKLLKIEKHDINNFKYKRGTNE